MEKRKIKILLVDDSNVIALFIKSILDEKFYNLKIISDGLEAYAYLSGENDSKTEDIPDVVLLDYDLPNMNGLDILGKLKENNKEYGIIFVTSDSRIETAVSAMKLGALDFICKNSCDINDLPQKIEKVYDLHNSRLQKRHYERKLEELNKTKDIFFSIIAHDLRNPFTAILGYCDLLTLTIDKKTTEDFLDFIEVVKKSATKAYQLLENLLSWSRSQTGHIEFNRVKFDIKSVVEENVAILQTQADNKEIKLIVEINEITEIEADLNMISTVLRNLINNSIKFTDVGGKIIIGAKKSRDFVEIYVKDNGVGISKENLAKLFKIDEKQSSLGTAKEVGSGLGLILCRDFVEKNGGTITVESEIDSGSTFRFTVPRKFTLE
ncbi:MAG TPA: hybrid sensor histidine kinase/response regulator [Spirochaetota bacterium]|nr:hybrid sensor histidine kinase/response regulator [Spirochaetota bacterium]